MLPETDIAISIAGLAPGGEWGNGARSLIDWVRTLGYRNIVLDGAMPGLRARDLDRSARRDLAGVLRRLELAFVGMDLWIPQAHFADPGKCDRALAAATDAMTLLGDLARLSPGRDPVLSLTLPDSADIVAALSEQASLTGVVLADHAWPPRPLDGRADPDTVGLDPATVLLAGDDLNSETARLGSYIGVARLSNASGAGRVGPDSDDGRLDDLAYRIGLHAAGYDGPIVLDLRGLQDQARIAREFCPSTE